MAQDVHRADERWIEEHRSDVARTCRTILGDEHIGADATQETLIRAWRYLQSHETPQHFGAWLHRIAVRTAIDHTRRRAVRQFMNQDSEGSVPATDEKPPEEAASLAEIRDHLDRALDELSEGQRIVFLLRHEGGYRLPEIAQKLGLSLPTIKTQFARACLKLQAALRLHNPDRNS